MQYKRRKTAIGNGYYAYPTVPSDAINLGTNNPGYDERIVSRTPSNAWGTPSLSEARALVETLNDHNAALLRTYHPGLASAKTVHLTARADGAKFWLLVEYDAAPDFTHAGGVEIHLQPTDYILPRLGFTIMEVPLTPAHVEPRCLLSSADLHGIRRVFPHAIGAQLLLIGHLVILYDSLSDFEKDECHISGPISFFCNLMVYYRVFRAVPSTVPCTGSALTCKDAGETCALGLRLKLPSGQSVVTTVTHGFVYRHGMGNNALTKGVSVISSWASQVCQKLFYGRPFPRLPLVIADTGYLGPFNLPLGKTVRLYKDKSIIGTITHTFDTPHMLLPYPAGYTHDLSLISGHNLPTINPPPGLPRINGWASIKDVLDGASVFVSAYLVDSGKEGKEGEEGWGMHCGMKVQKSDPAIVQGTQYLWGTDGQQSISLLWRTVCKSVSNLNGYSGAALCAGTPTAREAKAVVFQNFSLRTAATKVGDSFIMGIHGGFILPEIIYQSEVECGETEPVHESLKMYPFGERSSSRIVRSTSL